MRIGKVRRREGSKVRILQLITRRQLRGAEVFASQLASGLAARGHEVTLAGLYPMVSDGLSAGEATIRDLRTQPRRPLNLRLIMDLRDLIEQVRPDLVQANGSSTLKHVVISRRFSGGTWRLVYRNIGIASDWLRYPGHRFWGRWLVKSVDHVVAVSDHSLKDFRATYRLTESKISTVPIGVHVPAAPDKSRARALLSALTGIAELREIVVHVGSFTPEKNHLWLLEAFARVGTLRPHAHLLLCGDGPLRSRIASEIQQRGLGGRVHLLGRRDDASTLVAGADLFVLPSTTEGIPGALLEAAAQGVSVVATDVGGIGEAMMNGCTGHLVAQGDMDGFVTTVAGLLSAPERRREMGEAGRRFVRDRYDLERIIDRFEALYFSLCTNPTAGRAQKEQVTNGRTRVARSVAARMDGL
jgi:glycosyltransferase involved in cell wall biosynthesis